MGFQLIKTNYIPKYKTADGFDKIMLITKDKDGVKDYKIIQKPTLEYYISKPETEFKEYVTIQKEKCDKYKCYYKDLFKHMTESLGDQELIDYYNSVINSPEKNGLKGKLNKIHLDYRFHNTDINIEDSYIGRFLDKNPPVENNYPLTKFFYDIEVDGSTIVGFPNAEDALCEVNIISACIDMGDHIKMYMFCLNYTEEENKSYTDFMSDIKGNVTGIKNDLIEKCGKDIKVVVKRFRDELKLIQAFFDTINELRPDYVMGWNTARFDFPYLYNRIGILLAKYGIDKNVEDIMCPQEIPYKLSTYYIDRDHMDAPDNNSWMNVASYSVHIDQQNLYGNLRKAKGKLESYSLDAIAELELNEHKEELTTNIKTQHFDDYYRFFKYSANDTLLLYMLEEKCHDIEMLNTVANVTRTRVEQCLKKTICLRNLADKFYFDKGRIMSNNRSALKHKDGKPRGAFVAPTDQVDRIGETLFAGANPSQYIFEEVCDLDLSSLYPSIIIALNLSPETFIKKLILLEFDEGTGEYKDVQDVLIDEYVARDYVFLGNKYLGLPTAEDILDMI